MYNDMKITSLHISGRKMGTFINSVGPFINQCANKCWKLAIKAAGISVSSVRVKE